MLEEKEIQALISLLDDTDESITQHVFDKLKELGADVIPSLEEAWSDAEDALRNERLEELIHVIQYEDTFNNLRQWREEGVYDLLKATFFISKYKYPEIQYTDIFNQIKLMKRKIWLELDPYAGALEHVNTFNQIFYDYIGFKAYPTDKKIESRHFYLNHMLDSKRGNHMAIAILYLIFARRLDLPIYGVNLGNHLALAYVKDNAPDFEDERLDTRVLFFINPGYRGVIFSRNEIKKYLKKMQREEASHYYRPIADNRSLLVMLQMLKEFYFTQKHFDKAEEINSMMEIIG